MVTERKTIEIVLTNNDHVKLLVQILFFCNVDMKLYAIGRMTQILYPRLLQNLPESSSSAVVYRLPSSQQGRAPIILTGP